MELRINEEFKNLIPPLSSEEFSQLKENIINDGCREPLVTWNGIIIDGNNRYQICTENGVEFQTIEKEFDSEEDAITWIIKNQFGRRNLSIGQRCDLALKLEDTIKAKAKENLSAGGGDRKSPNPKSDNPIEKINTNDEIAKVAGVGHNTIHQFRKIKKEGTSEQIERAKKGGKGNSVNAIYNEIKSKPIEVKPETRRCKKCGEELELANFYEGRNVCKMCTNKSRGYRPTGIMADIYVNMKDPNDNTDITEALKNFDEADILDRLYNPDRIPEYTIDMLVEDFTANYKTYFSNLEKIIDIRIELIKDTQNNKKIMAILSEAEAAIANMKGKYLYE